MPSVKAGSTSFSTNIYIQTTAGAALTGLVFNTASLIAYYSFSGAFATGTAITLATLAAVNSAYSSGGFKEIDATHMPGLYRLDVPNAALAASNGPLVTIGLSGAATMTPVYLEIDLWGFDPTASTVPADMQKLNTSTANAALLASGASGMISGTAVTGTLSSTVFTTNLGTPTANAYNGRSVVFLSGSLAGQAQVISATSGAGQITVASAFTGAPSNGDTFIIV